MENQLSFVWKLSLEEMALRRVVAGLWTDIYILAWTEELPEEACGEKQWREKVEKVKEEVGKLMVKEPLKKRMMDVIKPIGLEVRESKVSLEEILGESSKQFEVNVLEQLGWSSGGAVDNKITAEILVRLEKLDVTKRFRLACFYCLEDSIRKLWEELPEESKTNFYDETCSVPGINVVINEKMVFYWVSVLKREESKFFEALTSFHSANNITFHEHAFQISACSGNKSTMEFFFQKLSQELRNDTLFNTVREVVQQRYLMFSQRTTSNLLTRCLSNILYNLLSVMSPEQKMQVFKQFPTEVLTCFMDWPFQDFFLDLADLIRTVRSDIGYGELINCVSIGIKHASYYIPSFIQKFFLSIPIDIRKSFVQQFFTSTIDLSIADDEETVKMILRNMPHENGGIYFCDRWFTDILFGRIKKGDWHFVEVCLREAALDEGSRDTLMELMYVFNGNDFRLAHLDRMEQCFESIDETESSASNNRSSGNNRSNRLYFGDEDQYWSLHLLLN